VRLFSGPLPSESMGSIMHEFASSINRDSGPRLRGSVRSDICVPTSHCAAYRDVIDVYRRTPTGHRQLHKLAIIVTSRDTDKLLTNLERGSPSPSRVGGGTKARLMVKRTRRTKGKIAGAVFTMKIALSAVCSLLFPFRHHQPISTSHLPMHVVHAG
jgi:hypothetical protein